MPSPPKIADRGCHVGSAEIVHQIDSKQPRRPDGNRGVGVEIKINLQTKTTHQDNSLQKSGMLHKSNLIDQRRQIVRHHQLHKQSPEDQSESLGQILFPQPRRHVLQLSQEMTHPLDRTRHQLGKKGVVGGIPTEVPFRGLLPPIHIDHVAKRLKSVKGYSNREKHLEKRKRIGKPKPTYNLPRLFAEKVPVFEARQHRQIQPHAKDQPCFS